MIAHHMLDWEEKLRSHLGLTEVDVHDIKAVHGSNPGLQRYVTGLDAVFSYRGGAMSRTDNHTHISYGCGRSFVDDMHV